MDKTIISVLGGLGGMIGWGTSDFLANQSSEKIGHFKTFLWSQVSGLLLFAVVLLLLRPSFIFSPGLIVLLVIGAIGYSVGYLYFYKAFEVGNISVVSAAINLNTILAMSVAWVVFGQRLSFVQIGGVCAVIAGVILVSVNMRELFSGKVSLVKGIKETIVASILFGVVFWPVNEYITERADWLAT